MADTNKPSNTRETIALVISAAMILVSVVYWIIQISDVMETMRLANGG